MPSSAKYYKFLKVFSKLTRLRKRRTLASSFDFSSLSDDNAPEFVVVLTQYRRNNLEAQLKCVYNQTQQPDLVIVYQNGRHVDVSHLSEKYDFKLVQSEFNTKYFGRFAYCLSLNSKYFIVMDDDILPAQKCFETYLSECKRLNAIVGANGRIAQINPAFSRLGVPGDVGLRPESTLVDFVGHMWVVKSDWLHDMFAIAPTTKETGEDMHLCFSAKLRSGIPSYVGRQRDNSELSDVSMNDLAVDDLSSFQHVKAEKRKSVEVYFKSLGLEFISAN